MGLDGNQAPFKSKSLKKPTLFTEVSLSWFYIPPYYF